MKEVLKVKHISKKYQAENGEVEALKDVSFSIKEGEFVSLIGPSGCGKSTLLRCINHLNKPTKGDIVFQNINLNSIYINKHHLY